MADSRLWRLCGKRIRASRRCLLHAAGNAGQRHWPRTCVTGFHLASLAPTLRHWLPPCHPERSRGICFAPFSLHKFLHELQHRMGRGTWVSIAVASLPGMTFLPFLLKEWFLCVSDAGAHVRICGRRKAQSRSLDCARDDKGEASGVGRQPLVAFERQAYAAPRRCLLHAAGNASVAPNLRHWLPPCHPERSRGMNPSLGWGIVGYCGCA